MIPYTGTYSPSKLWHLPILTPEQLFSLGYLSALAVWPKFGREVHPATLQNPITGVDLQATKRKYAFA